MNKSEIWVFAELVDNQPAPVYYELLTKAYEIGTEKNWDVAAVLIGNDKNDVVDVLKESCEKVYVVEHEKLENYTLEAYSVACEKLIKEYKPEMILVGATGIGSELAPTVAAKVKTGVAAHCIDIRVDHERNRINCMVPAFGGKVVSEIYIPETRPMIATIRAGILESKIEKKNDSTVISMDAAFLDDFVAKEEFLELIPSVQNGIKLEDADVVVAVGRGVSTEQAWSDTKLIADKLQGAIGWTRSFIDFGLVDSESNMIGTSGKSVKPKVFIGAGISGAAHFICGIGKSKLIINVNKDEKAKIFQHSDYGIVGDAGKFLNALAKKFE